MLTRRELLAAGAALTLPAVSLPRNVAQGAEATQDCSFLVLGDTHLDRLEHHDLKWLAETHPGDVAQVRHYSEHAATLLPELFQTLVQQRAAGQAAKETPPVDCLLHVGDFVEGLCGSSTLATQHCRDAIDIFERLELGVPLLLTKGNHDVTGPGAAEAYRDEILPFLGQQISDHIRTPRYAVRRQGCLFVMFDVYDKESLPWLKETLRGERPRRLFVVAHQPIVPFQARSAWTTLIKSSQKAARTELLNLFGEHRAIVLVGHVHRYGVVVRQTDEGPFVQVAVSSILSGRDPQPKQTRTGLDAYGPELVELDPQYSPESREGRRQILIAERPFIKHYEYADVAGHLRLRLQANELHLDVFTGTSRTPWRSMSLDALLKSA